MFHQFRCGQCGRTKNVSFDELGDLHVRYLPSVEGRGRQSTSSGDEGSEKPDVVEPLSREEYEAGVEEIAGKCRCGGRFTLGAPTRCPKCRSVNLKEGEITMFYD